MFTAKLSHWNTAFGLAQDRKNLWFAVSAHLHMNLLVHLAEKILLPQPLTFGGGYPYFHSPVRSEGIATSFVSYDY